jgi:L-lactate dehydrogenase complex protein LldG
MSDQVVDWRPYLPKDAGREELYQQFKAKAEGMAAKVIRVATKEEAIKAIVAELKEFNVKKAVSVPLTLVNDQLLQEAAQKEGIYLSLELSKDQIEQSDFGISEFDLGIAELGTIVQDANSVHKRMVSALPPTHLAIIETSSIVDTFVDSLQVLQRAYRGNLSRYIAYITGPSRTADIERVLTIGVHGPSKLTIICIG